jgi:hypothetical protein
MADNFAEALFQGMDSAQQRKASMYEQWTAARERGEARAREARLRDVSQKWYSTPEGQRGSLLPEIARINPQYAASMEQQWQGQQDKRRSRLGELSRAYLSQPDSAQKQSFYERFVHPEVSQMGFGELGEYDEAATTDLARQIVAAMEGSASDDPASIRELRILQDNPDLAELDMRRRQSGPQWDVVEVPTDDGGARQMERNRYSGQWREPNYGGASPARGGSGRFGIPETDNYVQSILSRVGNNLDPNASPQDQASILLPYLIQQESGGNPNAVSPKGARGATQVMPATGREPGFGVRPLQNDSHEENVRFGRDYLAAMLSRYPGRPDLALGAYNAGPGRADGVRGTVAQNGSAPRMGFRPPKGASETPVRTLTPDEIRRLGLPTGSVVQQSGDGTLKTVYSPKAAEGEGGSNSDLNPRQRNAVQGVQRNLIQYSASLTGKTPEEIRAMSADEIAKEIVKSGSRFVQGGMARVMSNFPGGETAVQVNNSDIVSYAQGAGAAWANYENPTGTVTNADRESATLQMPNPYDPPDVQASKIKNFLELSGYEKTGGNAPQEGSQPARVQNAADYNKLPSGATYITPDGQTRRKR